MSKEDLVPFKEGDDPRRNSTGLNKGSRWSKTIIKKYLDQKIKGKDLDEVESELPAGELAIIAVLKKAINGDYKALKELLDRLEGTSTQNVDHTTGGEKINGTSLLSFVETPKENPPAEEEKKDGEN